MISGGVNVFLGNRSALSALLYLYHYNPNVNMDELSNGTGVDTAELSEILNLAIRFNLAEIRPDGQINLTPRGAFIIESILAEAGSPVERHISQD